MPSGDITAGGTAGVSGDYHYSSGRKWFTCAISGTNYPMERAVRQRGLLVADIYADSANRLQAQDPRVLEFTEEDNPYGL